VTGKGVHTVIGIINQPWDGPQERVGEILERELAATPAYESFTVVVAFAKESGVAGLQDHIRRFLAQGYGVEAFVGIDALGTSREALQVLLDIGVPTHVFHNPGSTFHPKLYLLESGRRVSAIIGSSNLTLGGLYTNCELGVLLQLDLTVKVDAAVHARLRDVVTVLRASPNTKDLTPELLEELTARGLLGIETGDEAAAEGLAERPEAARQRRRQGAAIFPRTPVPPPPRTWRRPGVPVPTAGLPGLAVGAAQFVMVFGTRDARRRPGYSREIYVPIAARNAEPAFWRWPGNYVRATGTAGTYDERRVNILVQMQGGPTLVENVRIYYYHERDEFRLNCAELVDQSLPGDLLVLELPEERVPNVDYTGSTIPQGSPAYPIYSRIAVHRASPQKRWGYA
jgi:hypothetical protein